MKIVVVNVNTSASMTEVIAAGARRYASPGTQIVALRPSFGPEAVDCAFESYLSAVGVMDRVLAYRDPYDAVVLAGFGEHGRDADFAVLAPEESFVVDPGRLYHRHPATIPYAGRTLSGVVRLTLLRGHVIDPDRPHGKLLRRAQ